MHSINVETFLFMNGFAGTSSIVDQVFLFITNPLMFIILASVSMWVFIIAPLTSRDSYERLDAFKKALFFLICLFIVWSVVEFLKGFVSFPRPHEYLHGIRTLLVYGEYDSFPSLHAAFSFALATIIYYRSKRVGILLYGVATLVALSRVYVGVHFPLDVIVGALIGVCIPWALRSFFKN